MDESMETVRRWVNELHPLRVLEVVSASSRSARAADLFAEIQNPEVMTWSNALPANVRPTVESISTDAVCDWTADASFDLAYCRDSLSDLPVGSGRHVLDELRRRCRFVIVGLSLAGALGKRADASRWRRSDLAGLPVLAKMRTRDTAFFLIRGGVEPEPAGRSGRIVYLSPNREIRGGVKVLYNHVAILRSIGMPAVLSVRERRNVPASWWAWNPQQIAFGDRAATRTTSRDIVVIPEFRFREVRNYRHVACRLLFAQNPGLCVEMDSWPARGFDGVLTLGCPDGTKSKLHEFLESRTELPIFPITNHYSDDPWGTAEAERIPNRILALPRKGPEFVERLQREFEGIVTVDAALQPQMAVEYAKSDIYVHTGFPEGQPMPPIEAMLSGCVVCGFTGQGGLDVMRDGETAYVAPDGDSAALAESLRRALHDPNRESVRRAGQALAQQFHRDVAAKELRCCYDEWIPSLAAVPRFPLGRIVNQIGAAVFREDGRVRFRRRPAATEF